MNISLGTKLFIEIRKLIMPFSELEPLVPKLGRVLDVGCGHGTFTLLLANKSPKRQVLGIDPSKVKIQVAKNLGIGFANLKYKKCYLNELKTEKFSCIVVLDVLYLLPKTEKLQFLKYVRKKLSKNGVFILKEIENSNSIVNKFITFEETLMTKILKLTHSRHTTTEFSTVNEYKKMLETSGFKEVRTKRLKSFLPYPHIVFEAR